MKRLSAILSIVLVVSIIMACSAGSYVSAEGIAESIVLNTTIRDQRPDAYMFERSAPGLIQNMVNPVLGDDNTPVLNPSQWYKAELAEGDTEIANAVPNLETDYSTVSDFGFKSADFYRWYHTTSADPIGDILTYANTILATSTDPNTKLFAICYARYAVRLASDANLDYINAYVDIGEQRVYPATDLCLEIDNVRTKLANAAIGNFDLAADASAEIVNEFNAIYASYDQVSDLDAFLQAQLAGIDTSACRNVALNTEIQQQLVLTKDGDLRTFSDGTQGYIYSYDSSVTPLGNNTGVTGYFPADNTGFGNFNEEHNYHFTMTFENNFVYHGGETFTFAGDDDVWVYINNQLVLDIGGVHSKLGGTISLDALAAQQGFKVGDVCKLNFFFAERMTTDSNLKISTSIQFVPNDTVIIVDNPTTGVETPFVVVGIIAGVAVVGLVVSTVVSKKKKQTK